MVPPFTFNCGAFTSTTLVVMVPSFIFTASAAFMITLPLVAVIVPSFRAISFAASMLTLPFLAAMAPPSIATPSVLEVKETLEPSMVAPCSTLIAASSLVIEIAPLALRFLLTSIIFLIPLALLVIVSAPPTVPTV